MALEADEFLRRFLLHVLPTSSFAFATSAYSPTAIAPSSCSTAALICRPSRRHRSPRHRPLIVVNTAIAAPCAGLRFFLPANFPLGCPTHLSPRTLHDHRRPARSHQTFSFTPLPLGPD
jgi:hypothetical protein